jgi:hypothetical protein
MCTPEKPQTMASDDVPRRLASVSKTKPWADIESDRGPEEINTPEGIMWLAVIDKAITDYVAPTPDLSPIYTQGLDWFFYETKAAPCNLAYICDMIFDDSSKISAIRARVTKLKKDPEALKRFSKKRYNLRINSRFY